MIAAGAGARFVLALPGCCAAWSYPTLVVALLGALAWGIVVFRVALVFLAASVDGTRPRLSRAGVAVLGFVSGAIGAEAFWAMAAVAPEPLIGKALQVIALAWLVCCALLIRHRWRRPATVDRDG